MHDHFVIIRKSILWIHHITDENIILSLDTEKVFDCFKKSTHDFKETKTFVAIRDKWTDLRRKIKA